MKPRLLQSGILAFSLAISVMDVRAADCADCGRTCATGVTGSCSCCGGDITTPTDGKAASNLWEFVGNAVLSPTSQTVDVAVSNFQFTNKNITINLGDTVRWTVASGSHTVTSDTNAWTTSPTLSTGNIFTVTFNSLGLFPYYCQFHGGPGGSGMSGSVNVVAVPEPQAGLLSIIGCTALSAARWRRRKHS